MSDFATFTASMTRRVSECGAKGIPAGQVITNVNGKPGNNRNASSKNERNVFAGSRSVLNDVSGSNGRKNRPRLRENAGSRRSPSGQGGLPVKEQGVREVERELCGHS